MAKPNNFNDTHICEYCTRSLNDVNYNEVCSVISNNWNPYKRTWYTAEVCSEHCKNLLSEQYVIENLQLQQNKTSPN